MAGNKQLKLIEIHSQWAAVEYLEKMINSWMDDMKINERDIVSINLSFTGSGRTAIIAYWGV